MDRLYSEEQRMVRDMARRFAEERVLPRAAQIDRDDEFPADLYKEMADLGLFGIGLAEEAGGSGGDTISACLAMEEIARCSGTMGNALALPLEMARMLHEHGTDFHKKFIPGLLSGDHIPATCVTEPDFGSDVASLRTRAERDGDEFVISGTKAWVTFGSVADVILVFARTSPEPGHKSISCILVEGDRPGIHRGKDEELLGMHGLADCMITFDQVRVPVTNLLGVENGAFRMAMENFNFSRLMMSSMALGMAQAAMEDAVAYSQSRVQFGQKIGDFQAIQMMLADMSTEIAASRLLIHHACRLYDAGYPIAKEAAHAKLFTTDMAMRNVSNALQIHGGNGYSREYRIERIFRDVRLSQIYEGTNQIQRMIIARQLIKEMA